MSAATLKRLDATQVELELSISPEELEAARERAYRQLSRNARIPGFRPGKAPRRVYEATYGSGAIEERARDEVLNHAYVAALREHDLDPVDPPQVELLPEEDDGPLRVRATVNVRPQIVLGSYKGVALTSPSTAIPESEVDRGLEALRNDMADLVPVDRPVALGDVATLDYRGTIEGVPFEGGSAEGQPTTIEDGRFIPGFAQGILGMTAGETRTIEATFPEDYSNAELAGKKAEFEVTVHEVKAPEVPPLDDDFARRIFPEATLETVRQSVRARLEASVKARVRRDLGGQLLDKLLAAHDVPAPPVLVGREAEAELDEAKEFVARAGLEWDAYLKEQGKTETELLAGFRVEAERRVKSSLLITAIARAEKIEATTADIESEVAGLSRQYGQPPKAILTMLRPKMTALTDGIVRSKTLEFLLDNARVTESTLPPGVVETKAPAAAS